MDVFIAYSTKSGTLNCYFWMKRNFETERMKGFRDSKTHRQLDALSTSKSLVNLRQTELLLLLSVLQVLLTGSTGMEMGSTGGSDNAKKTQTQKLDMRALVLVPTLSN